jgi:hypothetical protein
MNGFAIPFPFLHWYAGMMELRIDVDQEPVELERELEALYDRIARPGDALHGLPALCIKYPGLVFRYREADGEHYIYVEDAARRCLAGYTVFNRLIELNRRADPHLRAPHSKFAPDYQRRGIASAIYRWWLESGRCLVSGARQSTGANALWHSLGRNYDLVFADLRDKTLRCLGPRVDERTLEDLQTRMILFGKGWSEERLAAQAGMLPFSGAASGAPAASPVGWALRAHALRAQLKSRRS